MRVLQVTPGYAPIIGGVERHVQAISEQLVSLGHRVVVAVMDPLGAAARAPETVNGVEVRHFSAWGPTDAYRLPRGFVTYLRATRNQFDVVHAHNYHAALIPVVATVRPQRFVVTPHLNDTPHSRLAAFLHAPYTALGRWAMGRAEAVICVSNAEQRRVVERLHVDPARTHVLPNGIDAGLLAAPVSDTPKEPGLLLAVGRLQAYKRIENAISALSLLPDHRLVIVGEGPHRGFLEQQAVAHGVADRVQFVGRATNGELAAWYARAAIVANFSEAEAFGMTVLEAVAAGCQVVCSDIPAFHDLAAQFPDHITVVRRSGETAGRSGLRAAAIQAAGQRLHARPANLDAFTWRSIAERLVRIYDLPRTQAHRESPTSSPIKRSNNADAVVVKRD